MFKHDRLGASWVYLSSVQAFGVLIDDPPYILGAQPGFVISGFSFTLGVDHLVQDVFSLSCDSCFGFRIGFSFVNYCCLETWCFAKVTSVTLVFSLEIVPAAAVMFLEMLFSGC